MTERPDDLLNDYRDLLPSAKRLARYALALEARVKEQGAALVAYAAVNECPGVLVEPGITSGCRAYATGLDDCPTCRALSADTEAPPLTEREETTASDGSDSGTPDERLRGTAVPPRTTSRSVSGADTEARTPEQVSIPDTCGDLPPDLVRVLRDPTITIQRDHEIRLADGRTLFEHLQEWRNAPSNTASADTEAPK